MQHATAINCVSKIKFGYSIHLYLYHCITNLQHVVEGQFLYPAENRVKFLILQEGTQRLPLSIMEGQNLDLGKI
jgi:hypothetical protein